MVEKHKHIVYIGGKRYSLLTSHSDTHVERIVLLLNSRLRDLTSASSFKDFHSMTILTALSLADDLITSQDDNTRLRRELNEANFKANE